MHHFFTFIFYTYIPQCYILAFFKHIHDRLKVHCILDIGTILQDTTQLIVERGKRMAGVRGGVELTIFLSWSAGCLNGNYSGSILHTESRTGYSSIINSSLEKTKNERI